MSQPTTLPPFYVGQEVVALETCHIWKKGDEFVVRQIVPACCKCPGWMVDVGPFNGVTDQQCGRCDVSWEIHSNPIFFSTCFAPKLSYKAVTFSEISEEIMMPSEN